MSQGSIEHVRQVLDSVYRKDSRRVLATLIRLLGDFDLAEDAMHDAFRVALETTAGKHRSPKTLPYTLDAMAIDLLSRFW